MARLGGIGAEAFDHLSASSGLGSILRDPKILSGTTRANVLLGLSHSPAHFEPKSPVRSIASSPIESCFLEADDSDEFKEEDVWAAESRSWVDAAGKFAGSELSKSELHWQSAREDLGFGFADAGKQRLSAKEVVRPSRRRAGLDKVPGLTDAFANVGFSPLSRMAEASSGQGSTRQASSRLATPSRMIPHAGAVHDSMRHTGHQSAPVNVPDWTKILGAEMTAKRVGAVDDDLDQEEERLPPHELLAKEYARSQRTTFSVCEGQGQTLKGRDLSRVRNAVWSQMGFAD